MAGLKAYHAKRDFSVTAEPRGKVARSAVKTTHRFVIQRHAATRLHYDFRLELDGVYKSWAVTKVPSLDPATKRLAVEVEDHPLEYGTFEGTIPKGQYGVGTVQLWDKGSWTPKGDDTRADLAKGSLKFELKGRRLKGGWALIRMREQPAKIGRQTRHNWLLIKERDEEARPGAPETLMDEDTSVTTGRTLDEIANSKKPRVWNSNRADAAKTAAAVKKKTPSRPKAAKRKRASSR